MVVAAFFAALSLLLGVTGSLWWSGLFAGLATTITALEVNLWWHRTWRK